MLPSVFIECWSREATIHVEWECFGIQHDVKGALVFSSDVDDSTEVTIQLGPGTRCIDRQYENKQTSFNLRVKVHKFSIDYTFVDIKKQHVGIYAVSDNL